MRDERAGEASPATLSPCATTVVTAWSQPGQDELSTQKMSHTHPLSPISIDFYIGTLSIKRHNPISWRKRNRLHTGEYRPLINQRVTN
jgi:hypothetical protein